ncbi:MAG: hypothetical protein AM324_001570 [Candidatus Thorarchaeota archaeon SMTZ1-83]|nr:MAG: hypothetical protein AM324_02475 [Candidatus Thorarchaeota archaeon SMTZ1-83]
MKEASLANLVEDLKVGFSFAVKNVVSFFLAVLGVLLVTAIILVIIIISVTIPLFFTAGLDAMIDFFVSWIEPFPPADAAALLGLILFLILPILAPLFVAFGALFGMAREIVESEGTTAEGVFTWYRRKFFSLAAGGILLFLIVIGPIGLAVWWILVYYPMPFGMPFHIEIVLEATAVVWLVMSSGMLSMVFPSIIDGHSALGAIRESAGLCWKYFDRVISTWLAFMGIILLPWIPVILDAISPVFHIELGTWYIVPLALFLLFIAIPALAIGVTRVYLILTGEETPEDELSFVEGN